jgi:alanine racemase
MGPTIAYIHHRYLQHNINLIRKAVGNRKIMAVVKANAYGHGDVEVARTALQAGCEYLGVAFVEEGIRLRQAKIHAPILVFGAHLNTGLSNAIEHQLDITVTSEAQLLFLKKYCAQKRIKIPVHIKIDTGMNRVGFPHDQIEQVVRILLKNSFLHLRGVYSHFSTADDEDPAYALLQIQRFDAIKKYVEQKFEHEILFHMANSGAIMKFPQSYYDMVRPGIMLYGQPPSPEFVTSWKLKEVMSLESRLGLIKLVKKNEPVSYSRRYYSKDLTHIGVIPIGYADGFSRNNTNNAEVIIHKKKYPLVGTVCMDMVMVDLGKKLKCKVGDKVVIYGRAGNLCILIKDIARRLDTISYEITCNVSPRVPRVHVYDKSGGL